jgi:uncharacterized LabA/DUF88 family protein
MTDTDRVMIYIDGSNVYHSLKDQFRRTNLNFERFCQKLVDKRQLIRIYYYNAPVDQAKEPQRYEEQLKFFDRMRRIPYMEVKLGRLVYRNWPQEPAYEKGIDVRLAVDMITHAHRGNYDVAILVSGDNDFADALQAVKDEGKRVEVALFGREWSSQQLRDAADRAIDINRTFLRGCWW